MFHGSSAELESILPPCEAGLPADEVDARVARAVRIADRGDAVAAFYLLEVDARRLYDQWGYASTIHYAQEAHDMSRDRAYRLLQAARACERCPDLRRAFDDAEIGYSLVAKLAPVIGRGAESDACGSSAPSRWAVATSKR